MKKLIAILLAMSMLCAIGITAFADDTGIQIIGAPSDDEEEEAVDLDDFKVGQVAHISGLGDVEILQVQWCDRIKSENDWTVSRIYYYESGDEAEYLQLVVRIVNTSTKTKDYFSMITNVVAAYDDTYEFGGWVRQFSSDSNNGLPYDSIDLFYDISPLYAGRYSIAITLPNIVAESDAPLSVSFNIGDSEFTYIYRE